MTEENRTVADEVEDEKIQEIKEEFQGEPDTVRLRINRVPKYVSDELKQMANEKFAGDYGMALTYWLMRHRDTEELHDRIASQQNRIERLERAVSELLNQEEENHTGGLETINS